MRLYGVQVRQGSEGPKHDPYGYTTIWFRKAAFKDSTLSGLSLTLETGDGLAVFDGDDATRVFEQVYSVDPYKLCRIVERQKRKEINRHLRTCCESRNTREAEGYPGESFVVCGCGKVLESTFDISAVE
jgi:hypothetical protein